MYSFVVELFADFVSLFYPTYCYACQGGLVKGEQFICSACMLEMPQTKYHLQPNNSFQERMSLRFPVKHSLALFHFSKKGRVQHVLHALKYKNHPEVGVYLGKLFGAQLLETEIPKSVDLIIPVPLHAARQRVRGYNQSAQFARGLSEKLNIPFSENVLVRITSTSSQTRKNKLSRWINVEEVFQLQAPEAIHKKHILLVDDVITTGATIEACAQTLLSADPTCLISLGCIAEVK